jgi:O-antigen ligase
MVAFPIVAAVALLTAVPARARLPLLALLVVVVVATGFAVMNSGHARFVSLIETVNQLAAGIPVTDNSVRIRIELYDGAWRAFLQSPLIGHGWRHMMPSVIALIPEADRAYVSGLPHLHNDVLNFMVFGGLVGLALYVTLLALPLVLALRSPADSQKRQRVMGVIVLVASYISMGLTDTMLSFELHTMLYVALTAILLRFCRDGEAAA